MKEGWGTPTLIAVHDSCTIAREYEVVEFDGEKYGCRNKKWNRLSGVAAKAGYCTPEREGEFVLCYEESGFKCVKGSWNSAGLWEGLGSCNSSNLGQKEVLDGVTFFCAKSGLWQRFTEMEEKYGECDSKIRGEIGTHNGKKYGCSPSRWREVTAADEALGFCDGSGFTWKEYAGVDVICGDGKKTWTHTSEWAMYGACDDRYKWKYGLIVGYEGKRLYCDDDFSLSNMTTAWHTISPIDSAAAKGKESIVDGLSKKMTGYDTLHTDVCGFSSMPVGYIKIFYRNGIDYTEELSMELTGYWTMVQLADTTAEAFIFRENGSGEARLEVKKNGYLVHGVKK